MNSFKNKRFLITHSMMKLLAGSEIVVLELAAFLKDSGAVVIIYTNYIDNPMKGLFEKYDITVITDDEKISLFDFDYIWINHQTFPPKFVKQIKENSTANIPEFIFLHMSGLKEHFLEQSYIWDFEKKFSSMSLFITKRIQEKAAEFYLDLDEINAYGLYENPAPQGFVNINRQYNESPKEVLIVSNHPPKEIQRAKKILSQKGIRVISYGEGQEKYNLIDPSII